MKKLGIFVLLLSLFACEETELDFPFDGDGTQIEIYLVKEDAMDYYNPEYDLSRNDLEAEPWLRHSEIEFYDWSSHTFYLFHDDNYYSAEDFESMASDKILPRCYARLVS